MTRPGVEIRSRELTPPRSAPTDTGVWFVAGLTERGPLEPVEVSSMSLYERRFGQRTGFTALYDAAETFFREGGSRLVVSRVLGAAPVSAFKDFNDAGAAAAIRVTAKEPGTWGNNISVQIVAGGAGGTFVIVVTYNGVEVERSPDLVDQAAALAWDNTSEYVIVSSLGSPNDPNVIGAQALLTGANGAGPIDADWAAALNRIPKDLGPGQVTQPGRTTTQAHTDTIAHAVANNRVAILDGTDTPTKATLLTQGATYRTSPNSGARYAGLFAPWVQVPGVTSGTIRIVPPSAVVAGALGRNDGAGLSPNVPAAGSEGQSLFALDLSQPDWTDIDRQDLNAAGVNIIRQIYGGVRIYGWRSLVDPVVDAQWIDLGNGRCRMAIAAAAADIGEQFQFDMIDGQGIVLGQFGGQLTSMLNEFWQDGSLYGLTPEEAFFVDVGEQVNTPATIAANELHAVLSVRMSPFSELTIIEIVKVPVNQAVV